MIHESGKNWRPFVRKAAEEVDAKFPRRDWTSTYAFHGENSPVGAYAIDFMVSPERAKIGQQIADYLWANRVRLGLWYVIWDGRIKSRTRPNAGWLTYHPTAAAIRRSPASAYHRNHPHASFYPSVPAAFVAWLKAKAGLYPKPKGRVVYLDKLKPGVQNSDSVWHLQKALGVKLTGDYDAATVAAVVKRFPASGPRKGDIYPHEAREVFKGTGLKIEADS